MGIVYILTNEAMPGLIKIERTDDDITVRLRLLNSVPGVLSGRTGRNWKAVQGPAHRLHDVT